MKLRIVYAVRATVAAGSWWLMDTCGGGTWCFAAVQAVTFGTMQLALEALEGAELSSYAGVALAIVPLVEASYAGVALAIVPLVEEVKSL